ncbi:MAG: hypothetical protein Q9209_001978 [Squamulea sp. 1 TL-2023]
MYTTFFAVLSLIFYVIENPRNRASEPILRDAHQGKDTLACLAPRSMAADRSSQYLAELFEQLPEALKSGRLVSVSQRKRPATPKSSDQTEAKPSTNVQANDTNGQSPIGLFNTSSSGENVNSKRASGSYENPPYPSRPILNNQSSFHQSPQQAFTTSTWVAATSNGFQQDSNFMSSMPASVTQADFSPQQVVGGGDFPDLSTMMFPSNDPFAYPNQPMSTLESLHGGYQSQPFDMQFFNDSTTGDHYSGINAPSYGPLPSYSTMGMPGSTNVKLKHADGHLVGTDGEQGWGQRPEQGRYAAPPTGLRWDSMFGEDWSGGWTGQSYR